MKHGYNIWYDLIRPAIFKLVGHNYGCCDKVKNCSKCCAKNGWWDWKNEEVENGKTN